MSMAFKAMEEVNGRRTEHWSIDYTAQGQAPQKGEWWFDPEIRVSVREEMPSGEARWLKNIVVGAVDPASFEVPDGWTKLDGPTGSNNQAPQGAASN